MILLSCRKNDLVDCDRSIGNRRRIGSECESHLPSGDRNCRDSLGRLPGRTGRKNWVMSRFQMSIASF